MKKIRQWFTLIELLAAIIVISIALISILSMLNVALSHTNKTRQETIAINLARESMESMYTRRNTNRLKWSGEKDKYWLIVDDTASPLLWFKGWLSLYRPILTAKWAQTPIFTSSGDNLANASASLLTLSNKDTYLLGTGDFIWGKSPDAAGKFYRAIIGIWLYLKNSNIVGGEYITACDDWDKYYSAWNLCSDNSPKEFRFCSRVEYEKDNKWKVELCGSITNYQE